MQVAIYLAAFQLLHFSASGQTANGEKITSVCEVLSNLPEMQGTIVTVRAKIVADVDIWLRANDCKHPFVVKQFKFGSTLATGWPGDPDVSVNFERLKLSEKHKLFPFDERSYRLVSNALNSVPPAQPLDIVVEGMVMTKVPLEDLVVPINPTSPRGFGHLGIAPAQLIIKRVIHIQDPKAGRPTKRE